jgi:hypothetical protein
MNELRKKLSELMPSGLKGHGRGPELKVPEFASDIYTDLRERRLLPLVGFLIVAIAAVPFLLKDAGEPEEPVPAPPSASASAKNAGQVVVVESSEGLRSYHQRLGHREPSNPFKQQYTSAPGSGSGEGSTLEEGSGEEAPSEAPPSEETSGGTNSGSEGGSTGSEEGGIHYFTYKIDVRVTPVSTNGVPSKAEPTVRRNLPELTSLPARKVPALTFMQPSGDGQKALMLVNSNVKGLFGEGVCVSGGETCQLLALKPGLPETVVYGDNERIFKIELLKVHLDVTKKLTKAPLGSPQSG